MTHHKMKKMMTFQNNTLHYLQITALASTVMMMMMMIKVAINK